MYCSRHTLINSAFLLTKSPFRAHSNTTRLSKNIQHGLRESNSWAKSSQRARGIFSSMCTNKKELQAGHHKIESPNSCADTQFVAKWNTNCAVWQTLLTYIQVWSRSNWKHYLFISHKKSSKEKNCSSGSGQTGTIQSECCFYMSCKTVYSHIFELPCIWTVSVFFFVFAFLFPNIFLAMRLWLTVQYCIKNACVWRLETHQTIIINKTRRQFEVRKLTYNNGGSIHALLHRSKPTLRRSWSLHHLYCHHFHQHNYLFSFLWNFHLSFSNTAKVVYSSGFSRG